MLTLQWSFGLMDKASIFEAKAGRLESCQGHFPPQGHVGTAKSLRRVSVAGCYMMLALCVRACHHRSRSCNGIIQAPRACDLGSTPGMHICSAQHLFPVVPAACRGMRKRVVREQCVWPKKKRTKIDNTLKASQAVPRPILIGPCAA